MGRKERGSFDYQYDKLNHILAVKWNDNAIVSLATNFRQVEPVLTAKRFSRSTRKIVAVSQPNLIASYNSNMGGADMLDNFVAKYMISMKGKKWWWSLFINFIDVSLCNAWSLHRVIHGKELDLLEFRRQVAISLLKSQPETSLDFLIHNPFLIGRPSHLKMFADPRHTSKEHCIAKNPMVVASDSSMYIGA